jgi:hypothetical protein
MRVEVELGPEQNMAAFDPLRRAYIENLQRFAAVEALGELLRRNLWQRSIRHTR